MAEAPAHKVARVALHLGLEGEARVTVSPPRARLGVARGLPPAPSQWRLREVGGQPPRQAGPRGWRHVGTSVCPAGAGLQEGWSRRSSPPTKRFPHLLAEVWDPAAVSPARETARSNRPRGCARCRAPGRPSLRGQAGLSVKARGSQGAVWKSKPLVPLPGHFLTPTARVSSLWS